MDVVILSRIQFAFNIAFHYLYPPLSIGLALMLVIMEGLYVKTKDPHYKVLTQFWTKIFSLVFAMGVATGIVQVFAFGNNWGRYSVFVGDVFGSVLAVEGIFAFFLEAGFLGVMLFGWDKVSAKVHYLATILVAFGAHFSAVWITIANSWMQTPAGYDIIGKGNEARAVVTDFWKVIFNPSSVDRIVHVLIGCWLTGGFIVLSVSAFYLLKKKHLEFAKTSIKIGLIVSISGVILQLISADSTARGVAVNQPEKLAALEGVFTTTEHTPITAVGYVDMKKEKVIGLQIPSLLSFLVYHDFTTPVKGLDQFPREDWPNVPWVFNTYHIMITVWGLMAFSVFLALFLYLKKKLFSAKWTLRLLVISVLFPYLANQAGWFTAEMGRQPWVVYHVLRTADGISQGVRAEQVMGSIVMFIVIYILLFSLFIFLLNRKIQQGPTDEKKRDDAVYKDPYQLKS